MRPGAGLLLGVWFFEALTMAGSTVVATEIRGPYHEVGACVRAGQAWARSAGNRVYNASECFEDEALATWRGFVAPVRAADPLGEGR